MAVLENHEVDGAFIDGIHYHQFDVVIVGAGGAGMRAAIEAYLEREEAYERQKSEDMQRWEHYLMTGQAIAGATMEKLLQDLADGKTVKWPE